jgi:hypothetical protein
MFFFPIRWIWSRHSAPIGKKWRKGSKRKKTRIRKTNHRTGHQVAEVYQWSDMSVSERSERHLLPQWRHHWTKKLTVPHSSHALVLWKPQLTTKTESINQSIADPKTTQFESSILAIFFPYLRNPEDSEQYEPISQGVWYCGNKVGFSLSAVLPNVPLSVYWIQDNA